MFFHKKDTTIINKRWDPRYIAMLRRKERKEAAIAFAKTFAVSAADSCAAGLATVALFAVMAFVICSIAISI